MFQACVYGLNNSIFFNEETIDSLKSYLKLSTIVDSMDLNNVNLEKDIQRRIDQRKKKVKNMMNRNDFNQIQNPAMDDSLKHLDRIVDILRAKKKYIFIEKK